MIHFGIIIKRFWSIGWKQIVSHWSRFDQAIRKRYLNVRAAVVEGEWDRRQIPHFYIKLRLACRYKETACTPSLSLESRKARETLSNKNTGLVARAQWQRRSLYFSITVNLAGTSRSSLALCPAKWGGNVKNERAWCFAPATRHAAFDQPATRALSFCRQWGMQWIFRVKTPQTLARGRRENSQAGDLSHYICHRASGAKIASRIHQNKDLEKVPKEQEAAPLLVAERSQ